VIQQKDIEQQVKFRRGRGDERRAGGALAISLDKGSSEKDKPAIGPGSQHGKILRSLRGEGLPHCLLGRMQQARDIYQR